MSDCQSTSRAIIISEIALVKELFKLDETSQVFLNEIGWTSRVYLINEGEFVVKFPRYDEVKTEYISEVRICRKIHGKMAMDVPEIVSVGEDYSYVAYRGMKGCTLDQVKRLTQENKQIIGKNLASFLKVLHAMNMDGLYHETLEKEIGELAHKFHLGKVVLADSLNDEQLQILQSFVETKFPEQLSSLGEKLVLSHGDLGFWNIIYKDDGNVGIIDFGDVGYYDESRDFVGMFDFAVLDSALQKYGDSAILRKKIELRQRVLPILELPYHIGKNNKSAITETIQRIREKLPVYQ
jgi:aminoglycoside phosphotransferase (APT) family kinase protein